MFNIYVERVIDKDINTVFEILADHEGASQYRGVKNAKLLEPGVSERNGLGALRHVDLGAFKFDERITCFERPHRLDYMIEKSSPLPFKHEQGTITLEEVNGATKVVWISKGTINIPILGRFVLDKIFESSGNKAFGSLLKQLSKR